MRKKETEIFLFAGKMTETVKAKEHKYRTDPV